MRKNLIISLMVLLATLSCSKPYSLELPLAVDSRNLIVKSEEGLTHILVYSTEDWTASIPADAEWLTLSGTSGNGEFVASYGFNDGLSRKTTIHLSSASRSIDIAFMQSGEVKSPAISFADAVQSLSRIEADCSVDMITNLGTSAGAVKASSPSRRVPRKNGSAMSASKAPRCSSPLRPTRALPAVARR